MKQVTEAVLDHILTTHPNARVEHRDGKKIVCIPTYDIDNDVAGWIEKEVIADPEQTRMGILPVFGVRNGPKFNPGGDPHVSPLGKLFRIVGFTPPKKDDEG